MKDVTQRGVERGAPRVERLSNGDLANVWSGPGSAQLCSACSKTISFDEVEIEVELPATWRSSVLRFHADCYRIWSGERDANS